jgi:hypothetical protein
MFSAEVQAQIDVEEWKIFKAQIALKEFKLAPL